MIIYERGVNMKKLKFGIMLLVILTIIVVLVACQPSNPTPHPAGKVTVVFELNGGEMSEATTVQVDKGSYLQLPVPTHTGYTFLGWFVGEGVNAGQVTNATAITQDITITAHWKANNYTVSFVETGDNAIADVSVTYGQDCALPTPIRTGYTFLGWFDGDNKVESGTWNIARSVTLVARWQARTYTVTFETGMDQEIEPMEVTFGEQYTLPFPEPEHYTFMGWYNNYSEVGLTGNWSIASDVTLVASWQGVEYTVTYNNAEDCFNENPTTITISQLPYTLKDAGKNDHVFEGWYVDPDFTTRVTQIDQLGMTLYAKFTVATSGLQFSSIYNGVEVIGYNGTNSDIIIPSYHNGFVTSIGDWAFYGCSSLESIVIPSSVTSIGIYAFYGCSSLESIVIPSNVVSIRSNAFYGCSGLVSIKVEQGNKIYHDDGNCLIETASRTLIAGCQSSVIPTNGSVTSIGGGAFRECSNLTNIVIPSSVTSIGDGAFYNCSSLESIVIPFSVTSIESYAFRGCSSLTSIVIPSNVTSIGDAIFAGCSSLSSITVEEGNDVYHSEGNCLIETASRTLIAGCQSSVIPADGSVTSIGDNAFYKCRSLTSIVIPSGVTSIGNYAFMDCDSLESIVIPSGVTSIGENAFCNCSSLSSITVEEGNDVYHSEGNCLIETASRTLIAGCQSSVIPADGSVTSIESYAFSDCSSLTSIVIPFSVTSIESYAFSGCSSLTIYCEAEEQPVGWDANWNPDNRPVVWGYKG